MFNGYASGYYVICSTKRFGPYTTIIIAGDIRDVLRRCYPSIRFSLTSADIDGLERIVL